MAAASRRRLQWHILNILLIGLFSFAMNQMPLVLSSNPYSIGNDGDSGFHVAIQMKLQDHQLFPKDIELNEMYLSSRPPFEFIIHRTVIWVADTFSGGNLFLANIVIFWTYNLAFIIGCYVLALFVLQSSAGAMLFAVASAGLSYAISAWWGLVYGAVVPHAVSLAFIPWFLLGYLRWVQRPRRLSVLFFLLGLAINIYPLQPAYLAIILLAGILFCRPLRLIQTITYAVIFIIGALPFVFISVSSIIVNLAGSEITNQTILNTLLMRHYGYLLPPWGPWGILHVGYVLVSPIWLFLSIAGIGFAIKRSTDEIKWIDRQFVIFTIWTLTLGLSGLVIGAIYRPFIVFLFHRASAFLYIPAYLGSIWLAFYLIRRRTTVGRLIGGIVIFLILFNSIRQSTLFHEMRGLTPPQSSTAYYKLAEWAAQNTPGESLFMAPLGGISTFYAFRVYSKRGVLLHWATGEIVLSNPDIGVKFYKMWSDVAPLYKQPSYTDQFIAVARKYHVDYIITDPLTPSKPILPSVYGNEIYTVYAVPPSHSSK